MLHRAAIRAPGQQDHIRPKLSDALNLFMGAPPVVGGNHIHDDGAGAQGGPLRAGGRHLPNHPGHHHLQSAAGAGSGNVQVASFLALGGPDESALLIQKPSAGQLLQLPHRIPQTNGYVRQRRFDRRGRFATKRLPILPPLLFDQNRLGRRAAAVGGQNHLNRFWRWERHG